MKPLTLTFKDQELEIKFNKEEEKNLFEKLFQILIAGIITLILGIYFWYCKGYLLFTLAAGLMMIYLIIVYYLVIHKKRFLQYLTFIIGTMSFFASGNQLSLIIFNFDFPMEEQRILEDGIMLAMFSFQISNMFLINTCQYGLFILFRIYVQFNPQYWIATFLTLLYSVIIIHNDYVRIKTLRNRFLLKEFNNNQLRMLENLEQPIIVVEFEQQSQKLVEYFVNKAFKFKNLNTIEFIKNCFTDRKNNLYTAILKKLNQLGPHQQLSVQFENTKYLVNSETYKGDKILVALEFIRAKTKNVEAKPYFYTSLLEYVRKHNQAQYKIQIMKNICGYLFCQPAKLRLFISSVSVNKVINLVNPQVIESETEIYEQFRSNDILLFLFSYLLKKCFTIDKLEIKKEQSQEELQYRFYITGIQNDKKLTEKQTEIILNILKTIVRLLGLDDLIITLYNCSFTLINLEERFLII